MRSFETNPSSHEEIPSNRALPPEIEKVRQSLGVDAYGLWLHAYEAAGQASETRRGYDRYIREGYVPSAVRLFCNGWKDEKPNGGTDFFQKAGSLPKSYIFGRGGILPPETPNSEEGHPKTYLFGEEGILPPESPEKSNE